MDRGELQGLLKHLCKVMWEANISNPITYVTQISYFLFLKMMEEWEAEAEAFQKGTKNHKKTFYEESLEPFAGAL